LSFVPDPPIHIPITTQELLLKSTNKYLEIAHKIFHFNFFLLSKIPQKKLFLHVDKNANSVYSINIVSPEKEEENWMSLLLEQFLTQENKK
jgi:hypothetical protein